MTWWEILVRAYRVLWNRFFWKMQPEDDEPEPVQRVVANTAPCMSTYVPTTMYLTHQNVGPVLRRVYEQQQISQAELNTQLQNAQQGNGNPYGQYQNALQNPHLTGLLGNRGSDGGVPGIVSGIAAIFGGQVGGPKH